MHQYRAWTDEEGVGSVHGDVPHGSGSGVERETENGGRDARLGPNLLADLE
jgi:hypothetical protein